MSHASDPERERRWREIVKRQRDSGHSIREFCRVERIAESSFHYWRAELQRRDRIAASRSAKVGAFVPLRLAESEGRAADEPIEMALPHGVTLRLRPGFDVATLQRIVVAMRDVPSPPTANLPGGERC